VHDEVEVLAQIAARPQTFDHDLHALRDVLDHDVVLHRYVIAEPDRHRIVAVGFQEFRERFERLGVVAPTVKDDYLAWHDFAPKLCGVPIRKVPGRGLPECK
jgi:hypothetical protein